MKRLEPLRTLFLSLTLIFLLSKGHTVEHHISTKKEKTFVVVVPKNTILFDIKNKKDLKSHKKILAKAFSSSPKSTFLTIVDGSNSPRFLVDSKNVFSIKDQSNMKRNPKFFKSTFKKVKKDSFDKSISLYHDYFFAKDFLALSFYNSKSNSLLNIKKSYSSLFYDLTFKSRLPLFFGISACFSNEGNQDDFTVSKIDFGVALKTKELTYPIVKKLQLSFYGLQTLFQKTTIQEKEVELSTSSLRLKISKNFTFMEKYKFKLGIGGSHHLSFFKKSSDSLFFEENSYFSYGIFIGVQNKSIL